MNRTAILFLALAVLLAHMVAIHQTPDGNFAPPYDLAHVAFRLGRNLVYEGELAWNRGEGVFPAYPSLLWIGVCALAERLYISPILVTQALGMIFTLGSVVVLTQFSLERRSGLIAPLLLAASGCAAAAGTSGTEASLSMLLLTTTMLAFERRRPRIQALGAVLLAMTQPTATWSVLMLLFLELFDRPRNQDGVRGHRALGAALAPFAALGVLMLLRHFVTGVWLTPTTAMLVSDPAGQLRLGLHYLWGFFVSSGSAPLLLIPLLMFSRRAKADHGRRALLVGGAWFFGVAVTGGSGLPFWNALAPALPLLFISIQDAITRLMDRRRVFQPLAIVVLVAGGFASLLVSKVPGSLGALRLEGLHRAWMTPSERLTVAYGTPHGRLGLLMEIRRVERLREVGLFLRDELPKATTISSAWPGAIGYLSRRTVHDLLGRTTPPPGFFRTQPWTGSPNVDVLAALARKDDYLASVFPETTPDEEVISNRARRLATWLGRPPRPHESQQATQDLSNALSIWEPVSVPVFPESGSGRVPDPHPALLLRRRDLGLTPRIRLESNKDSFSVLVKHRGHSQVVDLALALETRDGRQLWMRPSGEWIERTDGSRRPRARTDLLLIATGPRSILLVEFRPPPGVTGGTLRAQLLDPGSEGEWEEVGKLASRRL